VKSVWFQAQNIELLRIGVLLLADMIKTKQLHDL